jgi:hypothetical protein
MRFLLIKFEQDHGDGEHHDSDKYRSDRGGQHGALTVDRLQDG